MIHAIHLLMAVLQLFYWQGSHGKSQPVPVTPGCQAPYGVIFGGTDLNEDVKDNKKIAIMEQVLKKAR